MEIAIPFRGGAETANLPDGTDVLASGTPPVLGDPAEALERGLDAPIGCRPFDALARARRGGTACIVVSDHTRPVPYRGPGGILPPLLRRLSACGFPPDRICILVAAGTHAPMDRGALEEMLGPEPFAAGIEVVNHDCRRTEDLVCAGITARGTEALVNRRYWEADFKILTGLVESHFMAGVSGGRKSVCPGIFGAAGTRVFHGPDLMSHPKARDLVLEGNPVHEEALAVARLAGADFLVNVTLDRSFRITGVFCGGLEQAHAAAAAALKTYVSAPFDRPYDLVVTHGGFVARNHYQAAKAAVAASYARKPGGGLILAADNHDRAPVGSDDYRYCLSRLRALGSAGYERLLRRSDWTFRTDQWQVQMWARALADMEPDGFVYYAPQLTDADWAALPGVDGRRFLEPGERPSAGLVVERAVRDRMRRCGASEGDVRAGRFRIAWLPEGPYAIPVPANA